MSIEDAPPITEGEMQELRLICALASCVVEAGHAIGHTAQGDRRVLRRADALVQYVLTGEVPIL